MAQSSEQDERSAAPDADAARAAAPAEPSVDDAGADRPARSRLRWLAWLAVPALIAAIAGGRFLLEDDGSTERRGPREGGPTPVEVAPVERGTLDDVRVFTGTLEPSAEALVVAEVEGTVLEVHVDLADEVAPGDALAALDPRDYRQRVAAARADLRVARARAEAAEGASEVAARGLDRAEALAARGIASDRALDAARAEALEARSAHAIADAEVARAHAELSTAQLSLDRTEIRGRWPEADGPRRVAERHVDEGARVAPGDPLFRLVDVEPLRIAVMAGAADYARLSPGQRVELRDPAGGVSAQAQVARVAPSFDPASRQARVEIEVTEPTASLRPGMFVRARAVLDTAAEGALVPEAAVVTRSGAPVVFIVDEAGETVRQVAVEVRLRADGRAAVAGEGLEGRVVTLGQQRLTDGAEVRVITPADDAAEPAR